MVNCKEMSPLMVREDLTGPLPLLCQFPNSQNWQCVPQALAAPNAAISIIASSSSSNTWCQELLSCLELTLPKPAAWQMLIKRNRYSTSVETTKFTICHATKKPTAHFKCWFVLFPETGGTRLHPKMVLIHFVMLFLSRNQTRVEVIWALKEWNYIWIKFFLLFLQKNRNASREQWFSKETQEQVYLINASLVFQTFSTGNKNNLKLLITWTILQKVTADGSVSEQQPLLSSEWPGFFHFSVVKFCPTSIKSIIQVTASRPAHTRESQHINTSTEIPGQWDIHFKYTLWFNNCFLA